MLVGPEADPDPAPGRVPRAWSGSRRWPFEQLPDLAREAAVLVMPYADLPVTRAMQPLKLKEYLATGKPVVVRDLPATRDWADCLDLADTPEVVLRRRVRRRLERACPEHQAGRPARRWRGEGWAEKATRVSSTGHLDSDLSPGRLALCP